MLMNPPAISHAERERSSSWLTNRALPPQPDADQQPAERLDRRVTPLEHGGGQQSQPELIEKQANRQRAGGKQESADHARQSLATHQLRAITGIADGERDQQQHV